MEGYGFCVELYTHDVVRILCILHFFRMSRQLQEVETSLRISRREDLSLGSIFPWLRGADESIRRRRSACRRSCDVLPCCSGPRTPLLKAVDWSGRAGRYQQSLWEFQGRRRLSSSSTPHHRPRRRAREPRGSGALAIAVFRREREARIPVLTSCPACWPTSAGSTRIISRASIPGRLPPPCCWHGRSSSPSPRCWWSCRR
jgi:hypothetical protein